MPYQPTQSYYYQPPQPRPLTPQLKGRPVSGLEDVKAAAVDFDGSISFFPDLANGRIYTKQCNIDGTAALNMYEVKEIPTNPTVTYVTKEEFDAAIAAVKQILAQANLVGKSPDQASTKQTSRPEFNF